MELDQILERSGASESFKSDVRAFAAHQPVSHIRSARRDPRVKVVRVLSQLLSAEPELVIEHVALDAHSGCSDFRGSVTVTHAAGTSVFDFNWCCHWRAKEEGWVDYFGLPDQIRAAREFEWRCFQTWARRTVDAELVARGAA